MKYLFAKSDKLLYDNTIDEAVCMTDYVSEEKMIMERMMTHNIKKDILYYGIYSTADDMWNGSDVLCAARKRFFETGSRQKTTQRKTHTDSSTRKQRAVRRSNGWWKRRTAIMSNNSTISASPSNAPITSASICGSVLNTGNMV